MHTITYIVGGEARTVEAADGQTLAEAADQNGISLYGSCHGANHCSQCSREIVEGIQCLLRRSGDPYAVPEGYAPIVRTCQAVPTGDVTVNCDRRGRF